jgi:argininosuccinate lyase
MMADPLWGGRFTKNTDQTVNDFNSSIAVDRRLYRQDIRGSIAHAEMLCDRGILSEKDATQIVQGLQEILKDLETGVLAFDPKAEDIHMFIEKTLTHRIGEAGKRVHTGRSRNDQVTLDLKLYLKDEIDSIAGLLAEFVRTLLHLSSENLDTIMPGYTHLQRAQPITFAHHLMAFVQMFQRDLSRLADCRTRTDVMPLGSGALAGTTFNLDRNLVAKKLGFALITSNSLDGVSDRDYCMELAACLSILMVHLSRLSEEIVLWSSAEFAFIELDDAFSTGSSIMPQKKNPDVAELIRGKSGRVFGDLMGLLTVMKGLPLAYNKDMQEDKEAVFDAIDTVKMCLVPLDGMISTMRIQKGNMAEAAGGGFTNATDLADYLVRKGMPFRKAHDTTGLVVRYCIESGCPLQDLPLETLQKFSPQIESGVFDAIRIEACVNGRSLPGGPASETVRRSIDSAKAELEKVMTMFDQESR